MSYLLHLFASIKGSPMVWAQAVHFLIGYAVLLTVFREGMRKKYWHVGLLVFLFALGVEVFYDPKYEGDPFFWGGVRDMAFYLFGVIAGVVTDAGWTFHRMDLETWK